MSKKKNMALTKPRTATLLGKKISFRYVVSDELLTDDELGCLEREENGVTTIYIRRSLDGPEKIETILHELMHFVLRECCVEHLFGEKKIEAICEISEKLLQVMKNKAIRRLFIAYLEDRCPKRL